MNNINLIPINLIPVYPEIFLLIATSAILLIDMFLSDAKRTITYLLSLVTLVVCGIWSFGDFTQGAAVYTFHNMFVTDPMSSLLKIFSYLAVGLTLIYSRKYVGERGMVTGHLGGEFYVLALFALLGQMIMISANNFLIIYVLVCPGCITSQSLCVDRGCNEVFYSRCDGVRLFAIRNIDAVWRNWFA